MTEPTRRDAYAFDLVWLSVGFAAIFAVQMAALEFARYGCAFCRPFYHRICHLARGRDGFVGGEAAFPAGGLAHDRDYRDSADPSGPGPALRLRSLLLVCFSQQNSFYSRSEIGLHGRVSGVRGAPNERRFDRDVTTPPTFVSIIYDESDEICLDPSARSQEWSTLHQQQIEMVANPHFSPALRFEERCLMRSP